MKRNELSLHRKEQMAASLKKLMTRKNLGRITIQELADDCGINRYTFYYHFQDIYDLLAWTFRQDFEKLFADRSPVPYPGGVDPESDPVFKGKCCGV